MAKKANPTRLSRFIVAIAGKLTGEQLRECCNVQHDRGWQPETVALDQHQQLTIDWIMNDETMAQRYGYERAEGLEALREAQNKCHFALKAITDTGDYDLAGAIRHALWSVERLAKDYEGRVATLNELLSASAPVGKGPERP